MKLPRQVVIAYVAIQVAIPTGVYVVRVLLTESCLPFGWHMYSCLPR